MNAFLNPRNETSLSNTLEVTAQSLRLFHGNEQPKNINDIFIPKTDIGIAEPIEVQIDEVGNNTTQKYQPIGIISDEKAGGLESLLNYMKNFFSKDDPAINEHHYNITKEQYNEETHNIYNIGETKNTTLKIIDTQMDVMTIKNKM